MKTLKEVVSSNMKVQLEDLLKNVQKASPEYNRETFDYGLEMIKNQIHGRNSNGLQEKVSMKEALAAIDASILFPKVISDVMIKPREPMMIGQTLLSKTVVVDNVKGYEFPSMGALRASEMADGQEYREQVLAFTENAIDIKVKRYGLAVTIDEDVINDSMWDIWALHLEAMGYALLRKKEELIFNEFQAKLHTVFDNNNNVSKNWTKGRNSAQVANYSVAFDDFIDAMGALISHEYIPTDFIAHPLAWAIFQKDPILRNLWLTQGSIGQTIWSDIPDFDQSNHIPWKIAYQVSPFIPMTQETTLTSNNAASALAVCNITDVYLVDRNHTCIVLQKDPMSVAEFDNPLVDAKSVKAKERYGVGVINGGRAGCAIKNVRLEKNYLPEAAYYTVTPA